MLLFVYLFSVKKNEYLKYNKPSYSSAILLNTILCVLIAAFLIVVGKPTHWYDTIMVFPLGMWFAVYKSDF